MGSDLEGVILPGLWHFWSNRWRDGKGNIADKNANAPIVCFGAELVEEEPEGDEIPPPCTRNPCSSYPWDRAAIPAACYRTEKAQILADCVNSSLPVISRKFRGFGGIWATSGKFAKFRENSGDFGGIQWGFVWRLQ